MNPSKKSTIIAHLTSARKELYAEIQGLADFGLLKDADNVNRATDMVEDTISIINSLDYYEQGSQSTPIDEATEELLDEPKECPLCGKSPFYSVCSGCGYYKGALK